MGEQRAVQALAVRPGAKDSLHYTEVSLPDIGTRDVLVEPVRVGVCGTDREIIQSEMGRAPEDTDALVLGHEVLGRVVDVGPEVRALSPGALVTASVRRPDGCPTCLAGQPDMCLWGAYTERGIRQAHGFMSTRFVEDEINLVPVPERLEPVAVLTEPLTVVEKAVRQAELIQRRMAYWEPKTALVYGAGPIGILGTLLLRAKGLDVYTVARSQPPTAASELVEASGAHYVSSRERSIPTLANEIGPIDLILECSGASACMIEGMDILGVNGVMVLLGSPGSRKSLSVPADKLSSSMVGGNKVVVGSINAGHEDFEHAVTRLDRFEELWPGLTARMITDRLPFGTEPGQIAAKTDDGIKTTVEFGS